MSKPPLDARGVEISPGDTVIYGFSVSRSVAMAEGVVLGDDGGVSLTPAGRVRIRVVRRSYLSKSAPVVNLMPDRFVVLKGTVDALGEGVNFLPASPLPTQDEEARASCERYIDMYQGDIDATPDDVEAVAYAGKRIAHYRKKLEALDG